MKGFLLTCIALLLFVIVAPFAFIYQCIDNLFKLNHYFYKVAVGLDQFSNVFCADLLDACLRKKGGYAFGNTDETLSSCLGKNKTLATLTWLGRRIAGLLDRIENNHVENAIEQVNPDEN